VKTIGMITVALGATLALFAVIIGVRSIPDIRRYLKIRSM
jgi:hypothetical protein